MGGRGKVRAPGRSAAGRLSPPTAQGEKDGHLIRCELGMRAGYGLIRRSQRALRIQQGEEVASATEKKAPGILLRFPRASLRGHEIVVPLQGMAIRSQRAFRIPKRPEH